MNLSLNWIRDYVKLPKISARELGLALTMSTVEVDEVIEQEKLYAGIVIGKVLEVVKHPNADLLHVCTVDIRSERLQIVCGGINVAAGMLVAVATVGSKVRWHGTGDLVELEKTKIRGVESFGMIVSSDEIGLADLFPKKEEREILDLTHYQVHSGDPLAKALGLDDTIFVIDSKSMTHRPDLWAQYGLARELAAIFSVKLKPLLRKPITRHDQSHKALKVEIRDPDLCPRYSAVVLDNLTVAQSPWWLKRDLHAMGIRPINTVVDVTNYVMFLTGQPLHAFDYEQVHDAQIIVERMGKPRNFHALNEKEYTIPADALMIKDSQGPLAVAGVVGGKSSEIRENTRTIIFESANFTAAPLRRSSLAMGLRTEASSRYEKKLDPELTMQSLELAVDLMQQLDPGAHVASTVIDEQYQMPATVKVEISADFLKTRLGKELDSKLITSILKRLSFDVQHKRGVFTILVPTFRQRDISIPEDIVEEVARIYGYGSIEASLPRVEIPKPIRDITSLVERAAKSFLTLAHGYTEVYSYSFDDPVWSERLSLAANRVAVKNYLSADQRFLRGSLLPNLCKQMIDNNRWFDEVRIFEVGRVFSKQSGEFSVDEANEVFLPKQPIMVGGVHAVKATGTPVTYATVKGMLEQLCASLRLSVTLTAVEGLSFSSYTYELRFHDKIIGRYGLLKPEVLANEAKGFQAAWWELNFEYLVKFADFSHTYKPLSKYPRIIRDLAIVVSEAAWWSDIEKTVAGSSDLLKSIELFDIFESETLGAGKKSVAFRLTFGRDDRTLESTEVDQVIEKITKLLQQKFDAIVR